jgi:apolipoprotein N-acyltransferase
MLFSAFGADGKTAFQCGFIAGVAQFLVSLSWLLNIPYTFLGIPLAPGLGWAALSAYCALYTGAWVWICWRLSPGRSASAELAASGTHLLDSNALARARWALQCAIVWVGLEIVRGCFLSGFPWNFLGNSQFRMLPIIQIASVTGVFGVSFLIVWTSVSLGLVAARLAQSHTKREAIWASAGLPLLVVLILATLGASQLFVFPKPERVLKVALVQPSFPQTLIWDEKADAARFQQVMDLSRRALASEPDLLVWPESGAPDMTPANQDALAQLLSQHKAWMVICLDSEGARPDGSMAIYNSSFLLDPEGHPNGIYHKRRLVMFGEYVPLIHWLPFLKFLAPIGSGYTPGAEPVQFVMTNPRAQLSVLICFEDVFPAEARQHVTPDTDFLINLTNDGWFGDGSAQWQQTASAVFRAIENGLPLVRCSNNGITCWIDAHGRLRQTFGWPDQCYGPGVMEIKVPLEAKDRVETWYHRHGDVFGWSCSGLTIVFLLLARWRGKNFPQR